MAVFRYQALNADQQPISGELETSNVQQAISQLEADGLILQSISHVDVSSTTASPNTANECGPDETVARYAPRSVIEIEQAVLHAHMGQILERGRAIAPALRAYSEEMPSGPRSRQLRNVCHILEHGNVAEATAALMALPDYWIPLLSAATSSADPSRVLHDFLAETERADNLRRQRWQTLAYPFIVGCLALVVMTLLSMIVIPVFRGIFDDFDLILPTLTRFVLYVAAWLSSPWLFLVVTFIVSFGVLLFSAHRLRHWPVGAWIADRFSTPVGRHNAIARFAQFTADLLEADIPTPDALRIAGFTVNRARLRRAAWSLANDMDSGGSYAPQTELAPLTATIVRAIRSEIPKQARIRLLREIGTCYAERARRAFSWTTGLVEPFAICVVGLVVGTIVIALFMPLVKLIEGLSQ